MRHLKRCLQILGSQKARARSQVLAVLGRKPLQLSVLLLLALRDLRVRKLQLPLLASCLNVTLIICADRSLPNGNAPLVDDLFD